MTICETMKHNMYAAFIFYAEHSIIKFELNYFQFSNKKSGNSYATVLKVSTFIILVCFIGDYKHENIDRQSEIGSNLQNKPVVSHWIISGKQKYSRIIFRENYRSSLKGLVLFSNSIKIIFNRITLGL